MSAARRRQWLVLVDPNRPEAGAQGYAQVRPSATTTAVPAKCTIPMNIT
jgi:hypothetical protein